MAEKPVLEQARAAGMGAHLFFQSFGQLSEISPAFLTRIMDAVSTVISFRMSDPKSIDYLCQAAGALDALEQSFNVTGSVLGGVSRTGDGNQRLTKQMKIEHDVFKQLKTGQAVVIQRSPASEDLVDIWRPWV